MDQRERYSDPAEAIRMAIQYWQARLWTALPCVVANYPAKSGLGPQLLDAQPCVNGRVLNANGGFTPLLMPLLTDCVIQWQGGGGVTATFPIQPGDECLVVFSSRCIDAWWQNGFQSPVNGTPNPLLDPPDLRMHNLSDGMAFVGMRSLPREFTPDLTSACLITDDQQTFVKLNPTAKTLAMQANGGITLNTNGDITLTAGGQISANGVTVDPNSNVMTPATVTANTNVVSNGIHLKTHTHGGVSTGSGTSGAPTAGS